MKALLAIAVSVATSLAAACQPLDTSPAPRTLPDQFVQRARRMIAGATESHYSHKTTVDPERGIYDVDCSGLLVVLLREIAPGHLKQIPTRHRRPLAEDFYAVFTAPQAPEADAWGRVERLSEVRAGDVLAWRKLDRVPGDNTGHVMLIAEKPVAESSRRYRVRVLDSTAHGHAHDTRGGDKSGIGEGTIWLETDDAGHPIGYHWKSRNGQLHKAPIGIGRALVPIDRFRSGPP